VFSFVSRLLYPRVEEPSVHIAQEAGWSAVSEQSFVQEFLTFEIRPIGCPETSVRNNHYSLRNSAA